MSFLLTICMLAPESTTKSLSSGFIVDAAGKTHSSEGRRVECSFVLFFEFVNMSGKIPCLAADASLLSFSLFRRSVLEFHSVRTALMRQFQCVLLEKREPCRLLLIHPQLQQLDTATSSVARRQCSQRTERPPAGDQDGTLLVALFMDVGTATQT